MPFGSRRRQADWRTGQEARHAYECLRNLLNRNTILLERMSELEADVRFYQPSSPIIREQIRRMADETLLLIEDLNLLARDRFSGLYRAFDRIRTKLSERFRASESDRDVVPLALPLERVVKAPRGLAGNKAYNLSRVMEVLPDQVPPGFVVTTEAYWRFMYQPGLVSEILPLLLQLEAIQDQDLLRSRLARIREGILAAAVPEEIWHEVDGQIQRFGPDRSGAGGWAVRSSAEGEDGRFSFAGQFESLLNVPDQELLLAYRRVLQSRFHPRAYLYRRGLGLREIDTPMAVLFLRLLQARSAGVLYTLDPNEDRRDRMLIHAVRGLACDLVTGRVEGDRISVARSSGEKILEEVVRPKLHRVAQDPAGGVRTEDVPGDEAGRPSLDREEIKQLWEIGHALEEHFRIPLDIEWVIDPQGRPWVVQARPLTLSSPGVETAPRAPLEARPILEGGITVQAGRASGPLVRVEGATLPRRVPEGSILVVPTATPEIGSLLPFLAGCICETGNPAAHAAALLREWRVPSLFGLKGALRVLQDGDVIGLDATQRRVYQGCPWPEPAAGKARRKARAETAWEKDPLCKLVFPLRLIDPASPRFRPEGCSSLHDIIRFVHEKGVEAAFEFGDRHASGRGLPRGTRQLKTDLPLNIMVLDLGGAFPEEEDQEGRKVIEPSRIASIPFQAIWRGMSDPEVRWTGRRQVSLKGFTSVLVSSMTGSGTGTRRLGDRNYLLVSRDYMNLNLRLAYHYTMIDALVGESPENNFVNFRFRGGGAGPDRRELRARFLAETLLRSRFAVDRRGDLVTAWLRRYPRAGCEEALVMLGRLMACSRQLDMLIDSPAVAHEFAGRFLAGEYEVFR